MDFLDSWDDELAKMNKGKVGKPFVYPQTFIYFSSFIYIAFLPYRQIEGFFRKLSEFIPKLKSADYSTLCKRLKKLDVNLPENLGKEQKKRDFKKVHILVDLLSKKIIYCLLTKGTSSDSKQLKKMLRGCKGWTKIEIILGDTGYDTRECFDEIDEFGAIPVIKVRKNSSSLSRGSPVRRKAVIAQKRDNEKWRREVHYTMEMRG